MISLLLEGCVFRTSSSENSSPDTISGVSGQSFGWLLNIPKTDVSACSQVKNQDVKAATEIAILRAQAEVANNQYLNINDVLYIESTGSGTALVQRNSTRLTSSGFTNHRYNLKLVGIGEINGIKTLCISYGPTN